MSTTSPFTLHHFASTVSTDNTILIAPDLLQFSRNHSECIQDLQQSASVYWLDYNINFINDVAQWPHNTATIRQAFQELLSEQPQFTLCLAQGLGATFAFTSGLYKQIVLCNPSMKDNSIGMLRTLSKLGKLFSPTRKGIVQSIIEDHWRDQYGLLDFEKPMPWLGSTSPHESTTLSNATWHSVLSLIAQSTLGQNWWPNGILFGGKAPNTIQSLSALPSIGKLDYKVYPNLHANLLLASKVRQDIKRHYLEMS